MRLSEIKRLCPEAILLPSDYETYSLLSKTEYGNDCFMEPPFSYLTGKSLNKSHLWLRVLITLFNEIRELERLKIKRPLL
jgi:hypothetical protein